MFIMVCFSMWNFNAYCEITWINSEFSLLLFNMGYANLEYESIACNLHAGVQQCFQNNFNNIYLPF